MRQIWTIILFPIIIVSVYATSVTVTNTRLQAKAGVLQNVYYETASGPASSTPTVNTALTPPGSSGSYTIASGTSGYLWSPAFSSATVIPASRMTFDIWASVSSALALDGTASAGSGGTTTITIALTTTKSGDLVYVSVAEGQGATVSSVTSSPSLTWTQRVTLAFSTNRHLETWYAIWSASGTITITITLSSAVSAAGEAFGITGVNTVSPFDTNALIPHTAIGSAGTSASVTVSTSNANDLIIGAVGVQSNPALTTGTGFTLILTQSAGTGGNALETSDEYQVVSSTQTNLAVAYSWTGAQDWAISGDAVVAAAPISFTLRTTDSAGTLVSTLLGSTNTVPIPPTQTQVSSVFSISSGSIPAGGYLELIISAPSSASITVFWGVGQPTNFQLPQVVET